MGVASWRIYFVPLQLNLYYDRIAGRYGDLQTLKSVSQQANQKNTAQWLVRRTSRTVSDLFRSGGAMASPREGF
jgi:hypothetical protein